MAALNRLAANLSHELNNPASAAKSAASLLLSTSDTNHEKIRYRVGIALGTEDRLNAYLGWLSKLRLQVFLSRHASTEDAFIENTSLEESLTSWLESRGFAEAWKLAPTLAECGVSLFTLQELEQLVPSQSLCLAIRDVHETLASSRAILSMTDAADRIFRLVSAVKDYSYMDQPPVQDVNISDSLDIVLKLSQPKLVGITVKRIYNPDVPLLKAFGSELNQVWAALVENALDAMAGSGTLTLSTRLQGNTIMVEITDTGQGISPEYANRVFEPFFTTKPFGTGLGLGLDTVQRVVQKHFGAVAFDSQPGKTTFYVRLPLDRTEVY